MSHFRLQRRTDARTEEQRKRTRVGTLLLVTLSRGRPVTHAVRVVAERDDGELSRPRRF